MRTRRRWLAALLLMLAGLMPAPAAWADSWVPPRVTTYTSAGGTARLIVTPHFPPPERAPFTGRARGPSAPDSARAVLQRRDGRRRWVTQWQGPLRNEVAPVGALIADSGRYFVTFDDWGGTGGPNLVVIHDGAGRTIRALSLSDLLPLDYIEMLPRTFSSIWWANGPHRISDDGERLILSVTVPSMTEDAFPGASFDLPVALATGTPAPRAGPEWERAMATAVAARAAQRDRLAARLAFLTEPLLPPRSANPERWQDYLREAFKRVAPDWQMSNPWNMLVRRPGAPPYVWPFSPDPRTIFGRRNLPLVIGIGSPEGIPLAPALAPIVSGRRGGWLRGIRLYLVADDTAWPGLVRLFTPSGASLIQLDPAEPIPQRPERLPQRPDLTRLQSGQD